MNEKKDEEDTVISIKKSEWEGLIEDSELLVQRYNKLLKMVKDLKLRDSFLEKQLRATKAGQYLEQISPPSTQEQTDDLLEEPTIFYSRKAVGGFFLSFVAGIFMLLSSFTLTLYPGGSLIYPLSRLPFLPPYIAYFLGYNYAMASVATTVFSVLVIIGSMLIFAGHNRIGAGLVISFSIFNLLIGGNFWSSIFGVTGSILGITGGLLGMSEKLLTL